MDCLRMHECELCEKSIVCDLDKHAHNSSVKKNRLGSIKHFLVVNSNKGGLGSTLFSIGLASKLNDMGCKTALMETSMSSSLPYYLNASETTPLELVPEGITPPLSNGGFRYLSPLLFMNQEPRVVSWDIEAVLKFIKKMIVNSNWGDIDLLIVDMPYEQSGLIRDLKVFTGDKFDRSIILMDHKRYNNLQAKFYVDYMKELTTILAVLLSPSKKKGKDTKITVPYIECPAYVLPYVDAVSSFDLDAGGVYGHLSVPYASILEEVAKTCLSTL